MVELENDPWVVIPTGVMAGCCGCWMEANEKKMVTVSENLP
jgi:hypothetical protein